MKKTERISTDSKKPVDLHKLLRRYYQTFQKWKNLYPCSWDLNWFDPVDAAMLKRTPLITKAFAIHSRFHRWRTHWLSSWTFYLLILGTCSTRFPQCYRKRYYSCGRWKKMSKSLQNYPDPLKLVEKHGADALRFYSSPAVKADDLRFSKQGVESGEKGSPSTLEYL